MTDRRAAAIGYYNKAVQLAATDPRTAYRLLSSAVAIDPGFGQGWFQLGNTNADIKAYHGAVAAYRRALELPDQDGPGDMTAETRLRCLENLGHRLYHLGDLDGAEEATRAALDMAPESPFALVNRSLLASVRGRHHEAIAAARLAVEGDDSAIIRTAAAFADLFAGDYAEGLRLFEARFAYKLPEYEHYPYPRWNGERVEVLLMVSEQGLGDALSMARFVPLAMGRVGRVVLRVQPDLVTLLAAAMPMVEVIPFAVDFPLADAWCSLVSLPVALGLTNKQIVGCSGLSFPAFDQPGTGWKVEGRLHVGIAWAGSPANDVDQYRSLPFVEFLRLGQVPGVQLYGLQVGPAVEQLHAAGCAVVVKDLSPLIRDARDTAALMRELDLVVCCDSFVGHLAGALGVEAWVLLHTLGGDWRWGRTGTVALWYGASRCFRTGPDQRWGPVWDRVCQALRERVLFATIRATAAMVQNNPAFWPEERVDGRDNRAADGGRIHCPDGSEGRGFDDADRPLGAAG